VLNKLVALVLVVVLVGVVGLLAADLAKLHREPKDYQRVYGFSKSETRWSHRSQLNYTLTSLIAIAFCVLGVALAIWSLRSRGGASIKLLYVYLGSFGVLVLLNLFRWWQGGFDH
jgi:NADH:ubiquinone oxidoreductase subunit 3 (subunit A)